MNNQIIEGDCLQILDTLEKESLDCLFTDPPYSSGGLHKNSRSKDPLTKYINDNTLKNYISFCGDNKDQWSYLNWLSIILSKCYRLLKSNSYCFVFCDWRQLPITTNALQFAGFIWRGIIVWNKGRGARLPSRSYFRHQSEFILWGTKGECVDLNPTRNDFDSVLEYPISQHKEHPTEKPIGLIKRILSVLPKGSNVLDPFFGSGTTGLASLDLGLNYIGIEQSTEYVNLARARIDVYKSQLVL